MAATTPTTEPSAFSAGSTLKFKISLADYLATDGWTLKYSLVKSGQRYDISASADGSDHLVNVPYGTTAGYTPGEYEFVSFVEKAGERFEIKRGSIEIKANPTTGTADPRSHAKKTLDALDAWLESRDLAVAAYEIDGTKMQYVPIEKLIALRSQYAGFVRQEKLSAGVGIRKIQVRL